jgi:hypothetical protein
MEKAFRAVLYWRRLTLVFNQFLYTIASNVHTRWEIFFGFVCVMIVVTMMAPGLFGLVAFTQWGGMYTDGWCSVQVRTVPVDDLNAVPADRTDRIQAPRSRAVWSSPMHNTESCIRWGQSLCGISVPDTPELIVREAWPFFRNRWPLDTTDVCTLPRPSIPWYVQ